MNDFILIVDDNTKNLQVTAGVLKEEGYKISLAKSGASALALIKDYTPTLILLDIMMPEMNGFEVAGKLKKDEKFKDIPIIFLTAKSQTEDIVEGFHVGGVDYITKPFNREEMLARVNTHFALAKARQEIIDLNKTRDRLYSIIAHDIRSPFSAIDQTIQILTRGIIAPGSDDYNELLRLLKERTKITLTLLDNLLDWTRVQSGTVTGKIALNNIYDMVSETVLLLKGVAQEKNITISQKINENDFASCDVNLIKTVFRNLLSNALKFTPPDGRVEIGTRIDDEKISVYFKDSGIGLTKKQIDMIFNQKGELSTIGTNEERGTGLGLMMVQDFVEINNGMFSIESEENEGTTMIVTLPAK